MARLRAIVVARLGGSAGEPDLPPAALAELARRVAGLDATRSTAGGFRFQLELLLLRGLPPTAPSSVPLRPAPAPSEAGPEPAQDLCDQHLVLARDLDTGVGKPQSIGTTFLEPHLSHLGSGVSSAGSTFFLGIDYNSAWRHI